MCGNTSLTVTQKSYVPQYQILLQRRTGAMASVKHIPHQRDLGTFGMIRV